MTGNYRKLWPLTTEKSLMRIQTRKKKKIIGLLNLIADCLNCLGFQIFKDLITIGTHCMFSCIKNHLLFEKNIMRDKIHIYI